MSHQTGLPDALTKFGVAVELVPGWEKRGSSTFTPRGSIAHHTAGPTTGDRPSLNICVNGRSDLPGPLCNVFLTRAGVAVVVAAGRANHGGTGSWGGASGNSLFYGTEAESAGQGDWTGAQLRAYPRVHAAFHSMAGMGGADMCCAHREYATPAGRKPDPTGIDMNQFRADVAALLAAPPTGGTGFGGSMATDAEWKAWFEHFVVTELKTYIRDYVLHVLRTESVAGAADPAFNGINAVVVPKLDEILAEVSDEPPAQPLTVG